MQIINIWWHSKKEVDEIRTSAPLTGGHVFLMAGACPPLICLGGLAPLPPPLVVRLQTNKQTDNLWKHMFK